MSLDILIATKNKGKLSEYRRLFAAIEADFFSLSDLGLHNINVNETGSTFEENATLKAETYAAHAKICTVADDSGLMVDALQGAPGVFSARYGGAELDDAERRQHLLRTLERVKDVNRQARFVCVIAIADPSREETILVRGECPGRITRSENNATEGFGYDPVFQPDGYELTFGQMRPELKDGLSHRARAAKIALPILHEVCSQTL